MVDVKRNKGTTLRLICDDPSDTFLIRCTNRGEPYREGVEIGIENSEFSKDLLVMLNDVEARMLRDVLLNIYPKANLSG